MSTDKPLEELTAAIGTPLYMVETSPSKKEVKTALRKKFGKDFTNNDVKIALGVWEGFYGDETVLEKESVGLLNVPNHREVVLHYRHSDDPSNAAFGMAQKLKKVFRFYTPAGDKSDMWVYDGNTGIWITRGKEWISEVVTRSMSEFFKSRILSEVIKQIRNLTRDDNIELGRMAPTKMVMKNGVIDVETGKFSPTFRPNDYHITALPYEYDPDADCPKFKKFLKEICPVKDDKLALVEFMGYCLIKHHDIPVFVLLTGSGDNGKSTFLNIVTWMLGDDNTTAMTLQEISHDKFMKARLRGMLANVCPDIPSEPIKYTGTVKTLTGKDKMTAQHKHQDSFEFRNYCKLIFSGNQIPEFEDKTDAWYKRIRPIVFPNKFTKTDKKTIVGLEKLLIKEEISGIFNYAMLGWQRMVELGHLTGEKPVEEKGMEILKRSNSVSYFIAQYCKPNETSVMPVSVIYDCYNATHHHLKKMGYIESQKDPMTRGYFGKRLKEVVDYIIDDRQQLRVDNKIVWYYSGIEVDFDLLEADGVTVSSTLIENVSTFIKKLGDTVTNDGSKQETLPSKTPEQMAESKAALGGG